MRTLLAISTLLVAATPALAEDTFEARAAGAQRVKRIDDLVWALTAPCDSGTDTHQRQCRRLRDARAAELAGATLIVDADRDAFTIGAWSSQKKSAPIGLNACIRCNGVEVDGKTYYVVGTKQGAQPPRFEGGRLKVSQLHDNARAFPDAAAAQRFQTASRTAKVQLIVKVPASPKWTIDGKTGLTLDVLGYRVFSPCDGSVVCASPRAEAGEVDKQACGAMVSGTAEVEQLTPFIIKQALKPALAEAKACYAHHKMAGKAKVRLTIAGDGSVVEYSQEGAFGDTPTGACIDAAMKGVMFPRSKKDKTPIAVPIVLP
jgi:hypothetical protein